MLALAAVLASGCATRGSVRRLEARATGLEQVLGEVRRSEERLGREIARLSSEVQALEARIREAQSAARAAVSQTAVLQGRLGALAATRRSEATGPEASGGLGTTQPGRAYSRPPTVDAGLADPATIKPGRAHSRPPTVDAGLADPATIKPGRAYSRPPTVETDLADPATINRAYAAALATFRVREHGQAVLDFLEFIARYPTHPRAASAQYWIGEAYYAQRDYRQAIVEFEKVLERPGPNASAPDSLWKIGLCQANLRAPGRARETWQRLVREYPGSEAARRAQARLTAPRARVTR